MTALSANVQRKRRGVDQGHVGSAGVAASTKIFKGSLVSLDASGNLITTKATSNNCVGYARQEYDNSSGSAGDVVGEYIWGDIVEIAVSTVTIGLVHRTMYAKDDNTVVSTATTGPAAGLLIDLTSASLGQVLLGTFEDKDGT